MKKQKEFITGDIWLASAISILLKIYPEFKVENSKTLFIFPANDDTYRAISEFNSGTAINADEYSQVVKRLKSVVTENISILSGLWDWD